MDWTFPVNGPVTAHLDLAAGSVEVELGPTDEVKVRLTPVGRDSDRAREQIEQAEVSCDGSRLEVNVPKRWTREVELRLNVVLPANSALHVRTASADVACAGRVGTFEARTASGDVFVQDDCDQASVATASGDVRLASVLGQTDIKTASGDVVTHDIGGELTINTASGDVRAASVAHDARVRSASGDVTIGTAFDGDLGINTVSGDVKVGVGSGVGTWLDLVTVSGTTRCALPTEGDGSKSAATLRISCHTVSGDILIRSGDAVASPQPAGASEAGTEPSAALAGDLSGGGLSSFSAPDWPDMGGHPDVPSSAAELLGGLGAVLGDLNLERFASWRGPSRRPWWKPETR
ncbi:MAG TPA: DUF4097 family beta strand repeat-containing protein [Acidimicrobiales bacterium]|nr:DUF4097 family beta strand repeat-containing protein [Acidimicrobiales bacterium]